VRAKIYRSDNNTFVGTAIIATGAIRATTEHARIVPLNPSEGTELAGLVGEELKIAAQGIRPIAGILLRRGSNFYLNIPATVRVNSIQTADSLDKE
jgi:hypothetical protein